MGKHGNLDNVVYMGASAHEACINHYLLVLHIYIQHSNQHFTMVKCTQLYNNDFLINLFTRPKCLPKMYMYKVTTISDIIVRGVDLYMYVSGRVLTLCV